jgi:hypothetical protein
MRVEAVVTIGFATACIYPNRHCIYPLTDVHLCMYSRCLSIPLQTDRERRTRIRSGMEELRTILAEQVGDRV